MTNLTTEEIELLDRSLATLIMQIDDKQLGGKDPSAPLYLDVRELCRLRIKVVSGKTGVSEVIASLQQG